MLRFRASRGVERQQLRWVAAGAAAAVAGLLGGAAVPQRTVLSSILYASVLCIPLAVAVAVLRYRLWDLDRLVSRTVTYAVVTALLVIPYLLVVPAATRAGRGLGQPGRGRRHPGRGRPVLTAAPAGPGPGRPALQPPPL